MVPLRRSGEPTSGGGSSGSGWPTPNYLSFVVRVRMDDDAGDKAPGAQRSVRIEYVNGKEIKHFNGLESALQFISETVAGRLGQQ